MRKTSDDDVAGVDARRPRRRGVRPGDAKVEAERRAIEEPPREDHDRRGDEDAVTHAQSRLGTKEGSQLRRRIQRAADVVLLAGLLKRRGEHREEQEGVRCT